MTPTIKTPVFTLGGVILFNSQLKILSGKLKTRWTGQFTIDQVFPYGTVELSQTDRPNFKDCPDFEDSRALGFVHRLLDLQWESNILDPFVEIPSGESKVHIEVLSVLWENRLPIPDGSLPLFR
ncbi:hypothetical protein Tco_0641728 [Tanacetum coccineum]